MEKILNEFLLESAGEERLRLIYSIGNTFVGETVLVLLINGAFTLHSTVTDKRKLLRFTGNIDATEVKQLVEVLINSQIWKTKHFKTTPGDDDASTSIEVWKDAQKYGVSLFISEIEKVPSYKISQEAFLKLIRKISGNKILEEGR